MQARAVSDGLGPGWLACESAGRLTYLAMTLHDPPSIPQSLPILLNPSKRHRIRTALQDTTTDQAHTSILFTNHIQYLYQPHPRCLSRSAPRATSRSSIKRSVPAPIFCFLLSTSMSPPSVLAKTQQTCRNHRRILLLTTSCSSCRSTPPSTTSRSRRRCPRSTPSWASVLFTSSLSSSTLPASFSSTSPVSSFRATIPLLRYLARARSMTLRCVFVGALRQLSHGHVSHDNANFAIVVDGTQSLGP